MTARSKAFFITGQPVTTSRKFLTNNRPTEEVFRDLFDSIPFKQESADTATTSNHGLVKIATDAEMYARMDIVGGFQKTVKPSHLPAVGNTAAIGSTIKGQTLLNGIQVSTMQEPDGRLKYLIDLLIHSDFFKIRSGGSEELTMSDSFVTSWTALLELIDGGAPNVELADFPADVFDDGGIVNNGGVFTVDTDDSTMHIDSVTHKVKIKDGGVTLSKLQNLNAGEIIVAPTGGGTPQVISLLGEGKILVGTATGVEVKDINDYLLAVNISDNSIKARKLDPGTLGDGITKDMAASDASKLKINLAAVASMEFDGGALQLKNDALPQEFQYYGTDGTGVVRGWKSLANYSEMVSISKETGVGETTLSIDIETEVLNLAGTAIRTLDITADIYFLDGIGPNTYTKIVDPLITQTMTCTGGGTYVSSINYTGLTTETDYYVVVTFKRVMTP